MGRPAALAGSWAAACIAIGAAAPAWADAIDGHWCHQDGRRLEIAGAVIITPANTRTEGRYGRHDFSYVVPATDPGAGATIDMILLNEMTMRLKAGNTAEETWNRCGPPISLRGWRAFG
ncbi:MAG: hypothetical protein AB7F35_02725 [Acetobacteraceae bacterium]